MNKPGLSKINYLRIILKFTFLFTVLITTVLIAPASSLEKTNTSVNIENITSISDIIDSHFYRLAKAANMDTSQRNLLSSWSPDGSRLLILSHINPLGDAGLSAVYIINADGTEIKEIASTLNNTKDRSVSVSTGSWNTNENRVVVPISIFPLNAFYVIANVEGTGFRVVGKNITTIDSIRENVFNIERQQYFSWSPDGTKALVVMGLANSQIYIVDKDGFILRQLTNKSIETKVWNPRWSYDGRKIAFNGKNLWVINEDGTGLKLFDQDAENIHAGTIRWSLDDSMIFYQVDRSVRAVNVDGNDVVEIISRDNRTISDIFSLSPDGRKILFTASTNEKVASKLYVADSDGNNQKLIMDTTTGKDISNARWSPKGDKIAYVEDSNLYTVNPDGTGKTTIALTVFDYAWHPSGDYIAISCAIDKKSRQIFIAKPDGTERLQITSNDQLKYSLGGMNQVGISNRFISRPWSPDGSRLLIESLADNLFMDLIVIKFEGYDEVMSLHVATLMQQGEKNTIEVKSLSEPVQNATVTLNGKKIGVTNETGSLEYSFNELGRNLLNASKEGYRTANKLITVKEFTSSPGQPGIVPTATTTVPETDIPRIPGLGIIFSVFALIVMANLSDRKSKED